MIWAGHVARMGERRGVYAVLVGKPERKRPLGRTRRRWKDNIKMDLQEVVYVVVDWMELAQDRDRWRAFQVVRFPVTYRDRSATVLSLYIFFFKAESNDALD